VRLNFLSTPFQKHFFNTFETALPGLASRDLCLESGAHYKHHFSLRKLFLKVFKRFLQAGHYNAKTGKI